MSYRTKSELQSLLYGPRMTEKRETLFEDRTHCHADHVGQGMNKQTTAAVGVLKAVKFEEDGEEEGKEGVVSSGPQTRFVLLWVYMYYTGCVLDSVDNRPITVKHVLGGVSNLDLSVSQNTIHKL